MESLLGGSMLAITIYYSFAATLFMLVTGWVVYVKAGWPGWSSLIPIYNYYVLLQIAGKPWWWLIIMIVPVVNAVFIVFWLLHCLALAESFDRGALFGVGLFFLSPIFFPILAFSDIEYAGAD